MIRQLLFVLIIICACKIYAQSSISGTYMIGDKKTSIYADEMSYHLDYEEGNVIARLQYEENNLENDQIWLVWLKGKQVGTIVFKSDYSSGVYTDYRTNVESFVKKIE